MSKQGLIKTLIKRMEDFGYFPSFTNVKIFIREYEKLAKPEPTKPVVPQFVADWIEECKAKEKSLLKSLLYTPEGVNSWVDNSENQETFAKAWIFGYEVEKKKRYKVTLLNGQPLIKAFHGPNIYFSQNVLDLNYKATKKELEEEGFGWVFDCPGVEVEEVQDDR